ncbi:MAG: sulfatase-like hydrolase/transferase [Myxococcota bacterium]
MLALALGCSAGGPARDPSDGSDGSDDDLPPNVLVVVLDDVGRDRVAAYHDHPAPAPTPTLDQLAADGVLFRSAWATPLCSSSRAALWTGRYPSRTGIGHIIDPKDLVDHLAGEDGIGAMVHRAPVPYTAAFVGKWHLSPIRPVPVVDGPGRMGFDRWAGSLDNLGVAAVDDGLVHGYSHWEKDTDGTLAYTDRYATIDTTDDAIDRVTTAPEPWLVAVAYNAAHPPWHDPPTALHPTTPNPQTDTDRVDAMVESVDRELGRLLAAIPPATRARTVVVALSDNGPAGEVIRPPWPADRDKGSMSEASIRVPLIVSGPGIARGATSDALVHLVDLFPTIAGLVGVDLDDGVVRDGYDLRPILTDPTAPGPRTVLFTEKFRPNGSDPERRWAAIRDDRYKLVRTSVFPDELYDLTADPWSEGPDLLADGVDTALPPDVDAIHARLGDAMDAILDGLGVTF